MSEETPIPVVTPAAAAAPAPASRRISARSAGVVGLAVMCSRVLGLARELILAKLFGASLGMDAFISAFRVPNLLRDLFAEGALSTAFVTTFSQKIEKEGDVVAWRLANKVATMAIVVLSVLTLLGIVLAPLPRRRPRGRRGIHERARQAGPHDPSHADHVPLHPHGLAGGARHGDAQREERLRGAGDGLELLQSRLHRGRGDARLVARSALRHRARSPGSPSAPSSAARCNSACNFPPSGGRAFATGRTSGGTIPACARCCG